MIGKKLKLVERFRVRKQFDNYAIRSDRTEGIEQSVQFLVFESHGPSRPQFMKFDGVHIL